MNHRKIALAGVALCLLLTGCGAATPDSNVDSNPSPSAVAPFKVAMGVAGPQVEKLPVLMAIDALNAQGYRVSAEYLLNDEQAIQAVVQGEVLIAHGSTSQVVTAAANGIPIKAFGQADTPGYVTVAPIAITGPADLQGKRVGIHAQISVTTLLTDVMLEGYPNVKPEILIVPGSANRISALLAGELDASVVQLSDVPTLEREAPGRFHVIYDFAQTNDDLVTDVYYATASTLADGRSEPAVFLEAVLASVQRLYDSSVSDVAALIEKYVTGTTAETAPQLAELYLDAKMWPADGGLDSAALTSTIEILHTSGLIDSVLDAGALVDSSVLASVKKK